MGLGVLCSQKSYLSRLRRTIARKQFLSGLGCAAIPLRISTILPYRIIIHPEGMYFIGSNVTTTYSTWGNNPGGRDNGLITNIDFRQVPDAGRSLHINDTEEADLFRTINDYQQQGVNGWGILRPCSTFVVDAWRSGTGEYLSPYGPWSNPATLKNFIIQQNQGVKFYRTTGEPKELNGSGEISSSLYNSASSGQDSSSVGSSVGSSGGSSSSSFYRTGRQNDAR
jgi:hypothetical protein